MTTLVIAIGSVTNDFGTLGVAAHAVPLETPAQAARFNRRLVNACIRVRTQEGPMRPGQHHVAIIGGGATGTELAAELHRTPLRMIHERSLNNLYAVLGLLSRALSRRTGPPASRHGGARMGR